MTLGEIIDELKHCKPEAPVIFKGANTGEVPGPLTSWRGIYAQLALEHGPNEYAHWAGEYWLKKCEEEGLPLPPDHRNNTVLALLEECEQAVGKTYEGYKGGDFVMTEDTPVWVDNYGEYNEVAIIAIVQRLDNDESVALITCDISEYR